MIKVGKEREIKFDKSLRYERQLNYNIYDYDLIPFSFKAGDKKVYKNVNFNIFIDDYCNADCKFCVAQLRYAHKRMMYEKKHIDNKKEYLERLDYILSIVIKLNPSVSITGGEPTLSPILPDVIKLIDKYGFRKRTITTNGSGLFNKVDGKYIIDYLIEYNFDYLNISKASMDDNLNRTIMRFERDKEYLDNEKLKYLLNYIEGKHIKHRISVLLLKESVNSVEKIKEYIDKAQELGADNFIFRELMDFDKNAINKDKIQYCIENKIKLNDIWQDFENYPDFIPYLNILGYYYYVEIYKYKGMTVASESANLNQLYIEKEKHTDVVYEMVFHNNGNLCGSWIDEEDILDEY